MATVEWVNARIARTQSTIVALETAIEALAGGAQSYTLDTGQTRQSVTKANLSELRNMLKFYEERLAGLEAELAVTSGTTGSTGYARPAF